MRTPLALVSLLLAVGGCRCTQNVTMAQPSLSVLPGSVDFGQVKAGDRQARTLTFEARTTAAVTIRSITLEAGSAPGSVEGFALGMKPTTVNGLTTVTMPVSFAPLQRVLYQATLLVESDDPDKPTLRVPLVGEGVRPQISVTPVCERAQQCMGTVTAMPPAIDFGAEPLTRPMMLPASQLPGVVITNDGPVPATVTKVAIEGPDAAAFTFARSEPTPWELMPSQGRTSQLRFLPTSAMQANYQAQLVVESDDPDRARVVVALRGTLLPNQPPQVCFNVTRVTPPPEGGGPRDYASSQDWSPLLTPPATGYDFTLSRDVRPGDLVQLSALSDAADATRCTTDAELGRAGLTYSWRLLSVPMGARTPALATPTAATSQFKPVVTGDYVVELTVSDGQATTVVIGRVACAIKEDFVVQLEWTGREGLDLDLHLVRPSAATGADPFSGVFEFFDARLPDGGLTRTSGDLNGYARARRAGVTGADFNWGEPSSLDDPRLNLDNTGMSASGAMGDFIENISLNNPENDARCANAACRYRVFVHYFKAPDDPLANPPACIVDGGTGCLDGQRCSCAMADDRCVAIAAPVGDAGLGSGRCYEAPKPVVRLFFKGSRTAAQVIPLEGLSPPDSVSLGAPCQMFAIADVLWPSKRDLGSLPDGGTPPPIVTIPGQAGAPTRLTAPVVGRFGVRENGSRTCAPDLTINGTAWYGQNP